MVVDTTPKRRVSPTLIIWGALDIRATCIILLKRLLDSPCVFHRYPIISSMLQAMPSHRIPINSLLNPVSSHEHSHNDTTLGQIVPPSQHSKKIYAEEYVK